MTDENHPFYNLTDVDDVRREDELCPTTGQFLYSSFCWVSPKFKAYSGQLAKRSNDLTLDDVVENLRPVADSTAYPAFEDDWMVRAEDEDEERLHIKKPNLLRLAETTRSPEAVPMKLRDEIIALERIRTHHPHPNYVGYYGVAAWRGYAAGIVQEKFRVTLANRLAVRSDKPLDVRAVIGRIRATLKCLHGHGLAHNNIIPENIGMTADDEPKILNFSCCKAFGERLIDPGAAEANDVEYGFSSQIHDLVAVRRLGAWLRKEHDAWHPPAPARVATSLVTAPARLTTGEEDKTGADESGESVSEAADEAGGWAVVVRMRA